MRRRDARASPHLSPGLLGGTLDRWPNPPPESKGPGKLQQGGAPGTARSLLDRPGVSGLDAGAVSTTSTYRLTFLTAQGVLCSWMERHLREGTWERPGGAAPMGYDFWYQPRHTMS